MAQAPGLRDDHARGNAGLVHEGEEAAELNIAPAAKMPGCAQNIEPLWIAHSDMNPSPTPAENARRVPGATRLRSRSAP